MIRFFRTIRQRILTENKFNKYLLYAIGEILLVVVGILLALQIDTWNEQQKQRQESREFTMRLEKEVLKNIASAEAEMATEESQTHAAGTILQLFNEAGTPQSEALLDSLVYIILSNNTLEIVTGTLNEGFNTGKIAIITSDSLRSALYNLPSSIEEIRKQEEIDREDVNGHFTNFLYHNFNYRNMDNRYSPYKGVIGSTKFTSYSSRSLLDSQTFENMVDNRFWNSQEQLKQLRRFHGELSLIASLIEKVLERE
ncbi:MAG: DUF6090 family protein [Robiginitalea sp.]|nr:DUF6090 family protein [Robiginitalea sp.]